MGGWGGLGEKKRVRGVEMGAFGGGVGLGVRTGGDLVLWMMGSSSHDGIDG